jgi:hypothetical protein
MAMLATSLPLRFLHFLILGGVSLSLTSIIWISKGVYSDPAWGILAAEQYLQGVSSSPIYTVHAHEDDIAESTTGRVTWWAPSYQIVPLFFRLIGFDLGNSLKLTVLLGWTMIVIGWTLYFRAVMGTGRLWIAAVALFVFYRYVHCDSDIYSGGEFLLLAVAPWLVLQNLWASFRGNLTSAFFCGLSTSFIFLVKYSALCLSIGIVCFWSILCIQQHLRWSALGSMFLGMSVGALAIYLMGFPGGQTPFDPELNFHFHPLSGLWGLGAWIPAMTDFDYVVRWLFMHPARPLLEWDYTPRVCAVLGLITVPAFVRYGFTFNKTRSVKTFALHARNAAVICVLISGLLYCFLSAEAKSFIKYPRYLRIEALMIFPFIFLFCCRLARSSEWKRRFGGKLVLIFLFFLPAVFGSFSLVWKLFSIPDRQKSLTTTQGIRLDVLPPEGNPIGFYQELEAFSNTKPLYYLSCPELAFPIAHEHLLVEHVDFIPVEELRSRSYLGLPPGGVIIVAREYLKGNGKLNAIKGSFLSVSSWVDRPMSSAPGWLVSIGS